MWESNSLNQVLQTGRQPLPTVHIAAETGIEPISSESESDVIPLHYSAIADANGFEPLLIVLETIVLPVTLSIHTRVTGIEPILQESKACVLTTCTTPYYLSRKGETRTRDRLLIRQEFWPAELPSYSGSGWCRTNSYGFSIHRFYRVSFRSVQKRKPPALSDKWFNKRRNKEY